MTDIGTTPRAHWAALKDHERGRGVQLPECRRLEVEDACLDLFRQGYAQHQISKIIGASKPRVSRWINAAVSRRGFHEEFHLVNTRSKTDAQKLFDRIGFSRPSECWQWLGGTKPSGYGTFHADDGTTTAHRAVYEIFVGAIPDGMHIDHECRNPSCVNPRHLRPVWPNQNVKLSYMRKMRSHA